jgi:SAM-dependent methyltransferase
VYRFLGLTVGLTSVLIFGTAGCFQVATPVPPVATKTVVSKAEAKADDGQEDRPFIASKDTNLLLKLPSSYASASNDANDKAKLTVNGRDETAKVGDLEKIGYKDLEIAVEVDEGDVGKTIKIVYSHWPYSYSNTIRTKQVKLEKGKKIEVDFHKEDVAFPDLIKPIYVPTPQGVVDEMCKYAGIGAKDVVFDIGCGDGRLVITGVKKFGAKKGVGVDINADLVKLCQKNAAAEGVSDKVEFRNENALLMKDLSDATVVLLYVGEDFGAKLEPVLRKTLKKGARVVSHRFPLGDWQPDEQKTFSAKNLSGGDSDYTLKKWTIK